jgi:uncharacterized SAM-binding protein YcdF (DUF218 family)
VFAFVAKIAWSLVQPSSLIIAAFGVGLWKLNRDQAAPARRWLMGSMAALLIGGFSSLGDLLIVPLENRFPRPDLADAKIDGLIVLGGSEVPKISSTRQAIAVNDAAERYIDAMVLARRFPNARVVFSGGGEALSDAGETEAQSAARIFTQLGLAPERLTLEDRSRTTWENALLSAPLIGQKTGERWLLVTSAWQMPRAMGAFRKVGITVEAYPVDYRTTGRYAPFRVVGNMADGLRRFDYIVREYPALAVYWLTGRTTELFPGP